MMTAKNLNYTRSNTFDEQEVPLNSEGTHFFFSKFQAPKTRDLDSRKNHKSKK